MPKITTPRDRLEMTAEVGSANFQRKLKMAAERLTSAQLNGNQTEVRDAIQALGPFAPLIVLEMAHNMTGQDREDFARSLFHGLRQFSPLPKSSQWRVLEAQAKLGIVDREP